MGWWVTYVSIGALSGLLAGLLGVGGGSVVVPLLAVVFASRGVPGDAVLRLALGTSLAVIIVTASASALAHHGRNAVRWPIVWRMAPGLMLGAWLGALGATRLPTAALTVLVVGFLWFVAVQIVRDTTPISDRTLPLSTGYVWSGATIGLVSGVVGIGGGALSLPFLLRRRVAIHEAIGTSAAAGIPVAVAGAFGYAFFATDLFPLSETHIGFVALPPFLGIAAGSLLTVSRGASLAHRLSGRSLRLTVGIVLFLLGGKLLTSVWTG